MNDIKNFVFPAVVTGGGVFMIIYASFTEQNAAFVLGAFAVLIAGAISLVAALSNLTQQVRLILSVVLGLLIAVLAFMDYNSIKVPIEFQAEKERRYAHVVQRLKDIRTAQLAHKAIYQRYLGNTDSLVAFVKNDSIPFIKAIGEVPDTLTEEEAIRRGLVSRDTNYVSVKDSLFGNTEDRIHSFLPDSFVIVPFSGGTPFKLEAGMIERSGVDVAVFQATDPVPFDSRDPMQVGSMTDPKTNGNWE